MSALQEFEHAASLCSYHYADDTCGEWGLAGRQKAICQSLYRNHPELREDMLEAMSHQLWGGEFLRWVRRFNDAEAMV